MGHIWGPWSRLGLGISGRFTSGFGNEAIVCGALVDDFVVEGFSLEKWAEEPEGPIVDPGLALI